MAPPEPSATVEELHGPLLVSLAEHAPELLLLATDPEGRIVFVSAAARASLDRADGAVEGRPLAELLTEGDSVSVTALLSGAAGRFGPRLVNFAGSSGSPFTVRALVENGPSGMVLAGVRSAADESELGEELLRLNNELAAATRESARKGRALERTLADLRRAQSQLVHQEKMASLGMTTAGIAHEIYNPLAFVLSNNETLGRDFEDLLGFVNAVRDALPALRSAAPAVATAIESAGGRAELPLLAELVPRKLAANAEGLARIRAIVADLRLFSRLDEGEKKEVDLVEGLAATLRFIGPLARERDVRLEAGFPPSLRFVCAPGPLNQAVSNLVVNAIQASRPGQSVRVGLSEEAGFVRIDVTDEGCGIDAGTLPKIFDPFFTTKAAGEGTGLGLSITHQVVAAHGGRIAIESEPGAGARATILLPSG